MMDKTTYYNHLTLKVQVLENHLASVKEILRNTKESISTIRQRYVTVNKLSKKDEKLMGKQVKLISLKDDLRGFKMSSNTKARKMLNHLFEIYQIIALPDQKSYSINGIHLPNSDQLDGQEEVMIMYRGSKSSIMCNAMNQTFPLFIDSPKSKASFRFGLKLLELCIVELRSLNGLSTKNPDDILENLHDLNSFLLQIHCG